MHTVCYVNFIILIFFGQYLLRVAFVLDAKLLHKLYLAFFLSRVYLNSGQTSFTFLKIRKTILHENLAFVTGFCFVSHCEEN